MGDSGSMLSSAKAKTLSGRVSACDLQLVQTCMQQESASCHNEAFWLCSCVLNGITLGTDMGGNWLCFIKTTL